MRGERRDARRAESDEGPIVRLTKREGEILSLVFHGLSSQTIADDLFISRRTVEFHLANVYHKLEVNNRGQAFHEALRRGLVTLNGDYLASPTD